MFLFNLEKESGHDLKANGESGKSVKKEVGKSKCGFRPIVLGQLFRLQRKAVEEDNSGGRETSERATVCRVKEDGSLKSGGGSVRGEA